jgi:phage terminase large subunit GpA-like protein
MQNDTCDRSTATAPSPARSEALWLVRAAKPRARRSLAEFAEDEIVLPDGPFADTRFRIHRQPFVRFLFEELPKWPRAAVVGCVQSGKTTCAFTIPLLYWLFELRWTVVAGVPQIQTARDKWLLEILPVIRKTRYRDLVPTSGAGSRGGTPESIEFSHGAALKFMSGMGGDIKRSSFTAAAAAVTEVDKMDTARAISRETDPIKQIRGRTLSYGDRARLILECTASFPTGRIWTTYTNGTASRLVAPCPSCGGWIEPGRADLIGWQEAENIHDARRLARFRCPDCQAEIDDAARHEAHQHLRLVHRGQEITPSGAITGKPEPTDCLGFRWTAWHNAFWTAGQIGANEWEARASTEEEAAEREVKQFWWAEPWEPEDTELNPLVEGQVRKRTCRLPRAVAPDDALTVTTGVDLGKFIGHYVSIAWTSQVGYILDYGVQEFDADHLGSERATMVGLAELEQLLDTGYGRANGTGLVHPSQVWVDSGWAETQKAVYTFTKTRQAASRACQWAACKGYGQLQHRDRSYRQPTKKTRDVREIGQDWHLVRLIQPRVSLIHVNADAYKLKAHEGLRLPPTEAGALVLFMAPENEHRRFEKHVRAEVAEEIEVPGRGVAITFKRIRRANHYLDALALAIAAGQRAASRTAETRGDGSGPAEWFSQRARRAGR